MPRAHWLALLALALAAPSARADDWNRSFTVHGRTTVVVHARDGHVRVTEGTGSSVTVHVHTNGWRIGRHVFIDARQVGDRVEIEAREPRWNIGLSFSFREMRRLEIEVTAPRESDLEIRTGDGGVEVERIAGRVELETGDGHIRADGLSGDVHVRTGDGGVDVQGMDGRLSATSGDGAVRVSGRFDALDVGTGDGRVTVEAREGSKVGAGWTIESGDGSVTLRLPARIAADLDARTNDGRITTDVPISVNGDWGRHHLHGTLNGGGAPIRVRTGDGPIRLERI